MKDAKGHGSNSRGSYNAAVSAFGPAHETAIRQIPTKEQMAAIRDYRQARRNTVKSLRDSVRNAKVPLKDRERTWLSEYVKQLRTEHSASIQRQRLRGGK